MTWRALARLVRRAQAHLRRYARDIQDLSRPAPAYEHAYEPAYSRYRTPHSVFRAATWERAKRHHYINTFCRFHRKYSSLRGRSGFMHPNFGFGGRKFGFYSNRQSHMCVYHRAACTLVKETKSEVLRATMVGWRFHDIFLDSSASFPGLNINGRLYSQVRRATPVHILRAHFSTSRLSAGQLNNPYIGNFSDWSVGLTSSRRSSAPRSMTGSMSSVGLRSVRDAPQSCRSNIRLARFFTVQVPRLPSVLEVLRPFADALNPKDLSETPGPPSTDVPEAMPISAAIDFDLTPRLVLPDRDSALTDELSRELLQRINSQIAQLQAIAGDIARVASLGELPVTVEASGTTIRVHFPNSDTEKVALLMDDKDVRNGRVIEMLDDTGATDAVPLAMEDDSWSDDMSTPGLSMSESSASESSLPTALQSHTVSSFSVVSS